MKATPNLNFTTLEPSKESLKTFVTMLRSIYQNLTSLINGHIGFGDGSLSDNVDGTWINVVTPVAPNTDFTVNHNLNRLPVGYWIMQKDKAVDAYTGTVPATKTQLTLKASVASATIRLFIVGLLLSLFPHRGAAQGANHFNIAVKAVTPSGSSGISGPILQPIAGAVINVCTGTSMPPLGSICAGTASLFSDALLSVPIANPTNADINGNYNFWANAGQNYVVSVSGLSVITYSYVWTAPLAVGSGLTAGQNIIFTGTDVFTQLLSASISGNAATATSAVNATNLIGPGIINGTFSGNPVLSGSLSLSALGNGCLQVAGGLITSTGINCPITGGVTSVGLALPPQFAITGSPVASSGTLTGSWSSQYVNTVLGGPSTSGLGGIFDGAVTGTANASTTLPLTLKPNTASDIAFFHVSSSFVGQPSAVTVTGTGTWTTEIANGNVGGLFRQLLTSSSSLTATATLTNATNFAGSMFFLQTSGTPVFVQNKGTTGGIVNGTQLVFTGNTTVGNSILVVLNGTPPSAVSINATIADTQGNLFTPLAYVQNGSSAVATAWLATNIRAATLDTITLQTTTGTVGSGSFYMVEITNIAAQTQQPSFQILTPGHVRSFMQAAIAQVTTCPTVAAAGSTCTYTLTWPVPWPDATYAASCMGTTPVQFPVVQGVVNTTTTTVVTVENGTANEAQISGYTDMRCIGMSTKP